MEFQGKMCHFQTGKGDWQTGPAGKMCHFQADKQTGKQVQQAKCAISKQTSRLANRSSRQTGRQIDKLANQKQASRHSCQARPNMQGFKPGKQAGKVSGIKGIFQDLKAYSKIIFSCCLCPCFSELPLKYIRTIGLG